MISSTNDSETIEHSQKMNVDTDLTLFSKINPKWTVNLNLKCKTITLQKITAENLDDVGYDDDFLDKTPKTQSMKQRTYKLKFIKIKNQGTGRITKTNFLKGYQSKYIKNS